MEPQGQLEPQRHKSTKNLDLEEDILPGGSLPPATEEAARQIVDSAYRVHTALGPGLMESVYEACMCHELSKRAISFRRQVAFPIVYDGIRLDSGLRLDLLVSEAIVVELKAVEQMLPVFEAQLISYLKLTNLRLGFLINFNVPVIKHGIKRIIV
ncbi:MAG TPA: GxxExxY protein [Dehalococcoidia bacterium]|nr:GxxExxY protein [Dehalococcoidia bacterium]